MRADSAWGAVAALAASQHGAFNRRQAASLEVGPRHVRRLLDLGHLDEPVPGVLVVQGAPATWLQDVSVATLAGRATGVAALRTAAALHGLDGCAPGVVEIAVPPTARRPVIAGVVVHRLAGLVGADVTVVDGVRTMSFARTLAELGSVVPVEVVQQALDDARRRRISTGWLAEVAKRVQRPGVAGPGVLLDLLEEAKRYPVAPGSWLERLLELCLATAELPPVVRQQVIRCSSTGRFLARVDLAIPELLLGIEGHSRRYHSGTAAERRDEARDLAVAAEGWELLYLGWHAALEPEAARRQVVAVARARERLLDGRRSA